MISEETQVRVEVAKTREDTFLTFKHGETGLEKHRVLRQFKNSGRGVSRPAVARVEYPSPAPAGRLTAFRYLLVAIAANQK